MSWCSILPHSIGFIEIWLTRTFLLLGTLTISPWILLLVYDAVLYLLRTILHEISQKIKFSNYLSHQSSRLHENSAIPKRQFGAILPEKSSCSETKLFQSSLEHNI
ncbi:unnamed protein product [Blumeria hordei]|uniref:Uncharacterized protein n=1 Tax=Blumeria hordei TaxID=2867405 RepID=A0A383ULI0_BLUHO|nr:unnamed protein product [Blumeria hordei]